MSARDLRICPEDLYGLLLRERECAKALDLNGLQAVTREKEELLQHLEPTVDESPELGALAEKIRRENRRNAYLYWSTLKYIRESMSFFNGQVGRPSYGAGGQMNQSGTSGLVLKGRV